MPETEPEKTSRSTLQVILGFLLGVVLSLVWLFVIITLGMTMNFRQQWLFPVLNAVGLIVAGIVALRKMRESSYALGVVIALSLAFILDTACGVLYLR